MKQEFFFYSGLPRAGGTMLASVMNQHPDLYVSPLSPTVELLYYTEKYFDEGSEAYSANPQPLAKQSVLESLPREYYKNIPKKYIMDNNRAWPNNVDRICRFMTKNRCYYLMQPTGIVNQSLWSMYQGYSNTRVKACMHIVEYDDLISKPDEIMSGIVDFLDMPSYKFVFNNIENVTPVDDVTYNLEGMHSVRTKLASRNLDPIEILGPELVKQYSGLEYWREVVKPSKIKLFSL